MKRMQKGFTLIELMIVVAIIGILAAVAIPAYQDYVVKAKLSKVQSTIDPIKLALAMYYQENGSFPNAKEAASAYTGAGDLWASIGLTSAPVLPAEVSALVVDGTGLTSVSITMTLKSIKANSIDALDLAVLGEAGGTAISWSCYKASGTAKTTVTDPIALKYFGGDANPGCTL